MDLCYKHLRPSQRRPWEPSELRVPNTRTQAPTWEPSAQAPLRGWVAYARETLGIPKDDPLAKPSKRALLSGSGNAKVEIRPVFLQISSESLVGSQQPGSLSEKEIQYMTASMMPVKFQLMDQNPTQAQLQGNQRNRTFPTAPLQNRGSVHSALRKPLAILCTVKGQRGAGVSDCQI